jgi:hypothetical protein
VSSTDSHLEEHHNSQLEHTVRPLTSRFHHTHEQSSEVGGSRIASTDKDLVFAGNFSEFSIKLERASGNQEPVRETQLAQTGDHAGSKRGNEKREDHDAVGR